MPEVTIPARTDSQDGLLPPYGANHCAAYVVADFPQPAKNSAS
jgi:hypothetical protein